MVRERGYRGSPDHFRHLIACHRPRPRAEAYLRLRSLPGEQGQVDWAHFGHLDIGRARRPLSEPDRLRDRARALHLHGLLRHWSEVATQPWLAPLIDWEEQERSRRSLERRLQAAQIGRFKPLCDFDWNWPKRCDRATIEALMTLDFLKDATNVVLVGQNGTGKTMLAQNIAHQALIAGQTALFTTAG